jgi:chemotaxis regulatin CheY-phosphate phosphatase CheZ
VIIRDTEEILSDPIYAPSDMSPYHVDFDTIKQLVPDAERFISEVVGSGTRFGDYDVVEGIMSAKSYNDYIMKLINRIKKSTNGDITKK